MRNLSFAVAIAMLACGCATQQVQFNTWKGVPVEAQEKLKRGVFDLPKDKLFDAVAATLEHEPFLHWTFDTFDKPNGLIVGSAGLFRELQIRVTDAESGGSRMAVSIPRRVLKARAKIYTRIADPSFQTAYEPGPKEIAGYSVVAADALLEPEYFYSFTYRVLGDRTQVPFKLQAYADQTPEAMPSAESKASAEPLAPAAEEPQLSLPPAHRE